MRRYRKQLFENFPDENFNTDTEYELAYKRVKRIKGFYIHLMVYILVNGFTFISMLVKGETGSVIFSGWEIYSTPFFWGIGLVIHGMSVFGRNLFFGSDWEEKKIKEFMDKDKNQKWE